jgi:hypothetical protein
MAMEARMEMAQQSRDENSATDTQGSSRQSQVAGFYAASPDSSGRSISTYA